jgi:hypothetical protein
MSYICKFCKKKFSSKSNLNYHMLNTKYCLEIQGSTNLHIECDYCKKNIGTTKILKTHLLSCKEYAIHINYQRQEDKIIFLQDELKKKDVLIKELQDKLENIAVKAVSRPTTSNKTHINNFIQQLQPVTEEKLKESVDNLTIDHIKKGPEGYAQYALEYPLKDKMVCVDYSRRKVKFKDKDGNVITDHEMTGLAAKFFNSIKDKNKELICLYANELKEKLGDDDIMDTMVKIFDYKMSVDKGSEGEKTDFQHDFVRQMCSQTLKE